MIVNTREMLSDTRLSNPLSKDRWPVDYVTQDEGRLRIHPDFIASFHKRDWRSCESVMTSTQLDLVRQVEERDNCRVEISLPTGDSIRGYLKRHWTPAATLKDWQKEAPGIQEATAVGHCQEAGVGTMSVLAAGCRHAGDTVESFFLSREIEKASPADDFWKRRMGRPEEKLASEQDRRSLLAALASTARRFHQANLFHRDFYWCHFFVAEPKPGQFDVRLIDLQRVLRPSQNRWRWLLKDLAQFQFSIPQGYLSREENDFWFREYFRSSALSWKQRMGRRFIELRAWLYDRREQRR